MASGSESDLTCPVCQDIFRDPVLLSCSHSFCRDCLQRWWSGKQTKACPVCEAQSQTKDPPLNLALKNLCEAYLLELDQKGPDSEAVCSLHSEKLKLFCLDHQEPVCVVCRDSRTHVDHQFRPIGEAAQEHREELQKSLKPLQEKLKRLEQMKGNCALTEKRNKLQAQHSEKQIREQFKKLYTFLREEEEARIAALRGEERQKSQMLMRKIETLSRDISAVSCTIRTTEEELRAEDGSFLQNYKVSLERVHQPLIRDPEVVHGALIDVAKHRGNLAFNVLNKMKKTTGVYWSPVILDPNTAEPHLVLSEDLTSVRYGQRQKLPDNPERFEHFPVVLGSQGLDSGTHTWTVEVGGNQNWFVGVKEESLQRKQQTDIKSGLWAIAHNRGKYTSVSQQISEVVLRVNNLRRIRVQLDWGRGELSFYDPDANKTIYTFTHTFREKVFPFLYTTHLIPLKIHVVCKC